MPSLEGASDSIVAGSQWMIKHPTAAAVAGGAAAAGTAGTSLAYGRGDADTAPRKGTQAFEIGLAAAAAGGAVALGVKTFAKSTAKYVGNSFTAAFKERTLSGALLKHPPVALGLGVVVGGAIGSQLGDDPVKGTAIGAGVGAAGAMAIRSARNLHHHWQGAPLPVKAVAIAAAAVGIGAATRAFTHEDSYAASDSVVDDGMGGYEPQAGPGNRAAAMNATGDVVFGLHHKRH